MSLIERVKNVTLRPSAEWSVIAGEPASLSGLYSGYVAPLAAINPIALFIGLSIVGVSIPFVGTYRTPCAFVLGLVVSIVMGTVFALAHLATGGLGAVITGQAAASAGALGGSDSEKKAAASMVDGVAQAAKSSEAGRRAASLTERRYGALRAARAAAITTSRGGSSGPARAQIGPEQLLDDERRDERPAFDDREVGGAARQRSTHRRGGD